MAGFDFLVESSNKDRSFLRSLLHLSQRLASMQRIKLTYSWKADNGYSVSVDGELLSLQLLLTPLNNGLYFYAEGATSQGTNQYRKSLVRKITSSYAEGLDEITDTAEYYSEIYGGTPNSISFDVGKATHILGHVNSFTNSLTLYLQNQIRPHQIAEDAHTIIELLLGEVLGVTSRQLTFEGKVNLAQEKNYIDNALAKDLVELKNLRRGSKHKGQGISSRTMGQLLPSIIAACQMLSSIVRNNSIGN